MAASPRAAPATISTPTTTSAIGRPSPSSTGRRNWAPYPPELAELYRATRREVDPQKRLKLLADLQRRVRDWAPVVSLYQEVKIYAVSARVLHFMPLTDLHMDFRGVALRKP